MIFYLKLLIARMLVWLNLWVPVEIFYRCYLNTFGGDYTALYISRYPLGVVQIKFCNGPNLKFWARGAGILLAAQPCCYIRLKRGYLLFTANNKDNPTNNHLGYGRTGFIGNRISSFCTYTHVQTELRLKEIIYSLN